ncbi:hypothetical protein GCM10011402_38440 [Paracoccus acridae]|uniref:Uncharacterized protein n=1 Tax=Paracoccus acridae TaxID=1795310 RepID=A0ABQ1VNQ7_9RHOB|nr:hypothetical protein [Paracoccus acridae]GGF82158.1 hypothetical protein GCM10011402_38440 [Paracoccus acridae]
MFDFPTTPTALHLFVQDNSEALQHAAFTLGGRDWLRRTRGIIDNLRLGKPLTRSTRIEIEKLYGLLTLRYAADPDTAECGFAADIDPASPVVEEICLLVDKLEDVAKEAGLYLQDPWETDLLEGEYIS